MLAVDLGMRLGAVQELTLTRREIKDKSVDLP